MIFLTINDKQQTTNDIMNKSTITLGKGDNIAEVSLRKSHLAKKIIIRISKKKGIELIVPKRVSYKRALDFLYSKENWVLQKSLVLQQKDRSVFTDGAEVPILDNKYIIKYSGNLRGVSKIEGGYLIISGLEEHIARKVQQFLVKLAKTVITERAKIEAAKLGVKFTTITIRDTTSRWGSCSRSGSLSFSWRLVMAPRAVLEYVVAHEIAHLVEMNHSQKFWDVVASIFPHYKQARRWLKTHGDVLHSYGDKD